MLPVEQVTATRDPYTFYPWVRIVGFDQHPRVHTLRVVVSRAVVVAIYRGHDTREVGAIHSTDFNLVEYLRRANRMSVRMNFLHNQRERTFNQPR